MYHDSNRIGFFSLLVDVRGEKRQSSHRLADMPTILNGAYVQAEIKPFESLKIVPAYRVDKIQGDFTNEMTGTDYDINDYGLIKQPKISVVYSPWDVASFYANWGRTFQVGTGAAAYKIPPRDTDLAPSINEVGKPVSSSRRRTGWMVESPIGSKRLPGRSVAG